MIRKDEEVVILKLHNNIDKIVLCARFDANKRSLNYFM